MSYITSLLTRPTTLGLVAVAGSGVFYLGLKSKTTMAQQAQRDGRGSQSKAGESADKEKTYEVRAGREGGGV